MSILGREKRAKEMNLTNTWGGSDCTTISLVQRHPAPWRQLCVSRCGFVKHLVTEQRQDIFKSVLTAFPHKKQNSTANTIPYKVAYVSDGKTEVKKGICGALPRVAGFLGPVVTRVWQILFSTSSWIDHLNSLPFPSSDFAFLLSLVAC